MHERFNAVLDIFALVATYPSDARVLAEYTQREALDYLTSGDPKHLIVLVRLATALGLVPEDLAKLHQEFL